LFLFVSYNKNKVNGFGLCLQWIFHQIQLGSYQRALPVPGILKLCNYLQNVVAITYIFGLQLSTFLFYNKHFEQNSLYQVLEEQYHIQITTTSLKLKAVSAYGNISRFIDVKRLLLYKSKKWS